MARLRKYKAKPVKDIHFHIRFHATTGCGRHWKEFWPPGGPEESYNRGSLPYGLSSGVYQRVTCQGCLEFLYNKKRQEMAEIEVRLDVFWEGARRDTRVQETV